MKTTFRFLVLLALLGTGPACSTSMRYDHRMPAFSPVPVYFDMKNRSTGRLKTHYLANTLFQNLKDVSYVNSGKRVAVLPLADLEDLRRTSAFGQLIGEQLIHELSRVGFDLVEIRSDDAVELIEKVGEFLLVRDSLDGTHTIKKMDLAGYYGVEALVCGTYLVDMEKDTAYLNVRLLDLASFGVLSTATVEVDIPDSLLTLKSANQLEGVRVHHRAP